MLRNRPCTWMTLALAWVAVVVAPAAATGQTTPEDVGRELASLRRELQALRAEVESLRRSGPDRPQQARKPKHQPMRLKAPPCPRR